MFQHTQTDPLHPSICHTPGLQSLVVSLVLIRLRLRCTRRSACPQTVPNAGAQLMFSSNKCHHVCKLHWLRVLQRIDDKIAVVYRCLHGLVPAHLSVDLQSIKDLPSRRLRSCFYVSHPDVEPVHCR